MYRDYVISDTFLDANAWKLLVDKIQFLKVNTFSGEKKSWKYEHLKCYKTLKKT